MMKSDITKVLPIAMLLAFTSCHKAEDIINSFDKISYQSYLRNESGQDVTVIMRPGRHPIHYNFSWHILKDSIVEIPDTERWGLTLRIYESDTVFFQFADGTTVLHYYLTENYPSDKHIFVPEENNIFKIGLGIPDKEETWTTTKIRPQKYRCEYVIK